MIEIYSSKDYREILLDRIKAAPGGTRGQLLKLSKAAGVHPSVLSQVFRGQRELSSEQAVLAAEYFELHEPEVRYLLLLVQLERAGNSNLRELIEKDLAHIRDQARQVSNRIPISTSLSDEQKAVFYSNWFYSGMRIFSSIPRLQDAQALRKKLGLGLEQFREVLNFLLQHGLVKVVSEKVSPVVQSTHLDGKSPLIARHHGNWRLKAMQRHPSLDLNRELAYTSPISIAEADIPRVRKILLDAIEQCCEISDPSASEEAFCLNIDWFEIT